MELNPTLQWTYNYSPVLIIDAFQYLSPPSQRPYLAIIDGLDECHDKATQQLILRLMYEMITVHELPLRFLT